MAEDHNPRAAPGDNNPPANPFIANLEEKNAAILNEMAQLELDRRRLPKVVETDEHVAAINAWVTKSRGLARRVEMARVEAKAPYLEREKQIDGWFGEVRKPLLDRATEVEKLNGPYLVAKQKAAEAAQRAEADRLRKEAAEAKRKADEAAAAEAAARRAREAEEQRLRDEEKERQAKAAREAQQAAASTSQPQPLSPPAPAPAVEQAYRDASSSVTAASKAADQAAEDARRAEKAAERAEKKAETPGLGKTQGGGANARAEMVWIGKVRAWPAVIQSLGPLGQFFNETMIQEAIDRAARVKERPVVPGVEFVEEVAVKTSATRTGK